MAGTELKQSKDAPLSFFSFQDIIASVTALMVLITLVIALDPIGDEFVTRKRSAGAEPMSQAARVEQARARVDTANAALQETRRILMERQAQQVVTADQVARLDRLVAAERAEADALQRIESAGDSERKSVADRTLIAQQALADAERELVRRREAAADSAMKGRVRAFSGPAESLKPLLLEVGAERLVAGTLDDRRIPRELATCLGADDVAVECMSLTLAQHPAAEWYVLFIVRQDAVERFRRLREALYGRGYEIGWQIWDGSAGGFFERPEPSAPPPDAGIPSARSPNGDPVGPAPVVPAAVASILRAPKRGRKGGSIGTDPFGLFLDALCNTLGVVMLVLMCILVFSKDGEGESDPKATEAEAIRLEAIAAELEQELRGALEAVSKLPPAGDPALVGRWNQLLAEGERVRDKTATLRESIAAIRKELERRSSELAEIALRLREMEAKVSSIALASPAEDNFIRLSRFRTDARAPLLLAVSGGRVSAPALAPGARELAPPKGGLPLVADSDAVAAVDQLVGTRTPGEIRIEVAVWSDSFGGYKKLERLLVERGYAINPLPVQAGESLKAGVGGAQ